MKKKFQQNNAIITEIIARKPDAVVITHNDAWLMIGRLGWRSMSDEEKSKNDTDKNLLITKHTEDVISSQLKDEIAYLGIVQIKLEEVIEILVEHAQHKMQPFGRYQEDRLDGKKLPLYESTLYQNIAKQGVLVLPNEAFDCQLYNGSPEHHALLDDGVLYMDHCNNELTRRKIAYREERKNQQKHTL